MKPQIRIKTSLHLDDSITSDFIDECESIVRVEAGGKDITLSATPPTIIELIGSLLDWSIPFKAAATAYVVQVASQLGKHSGDKIWETGSDFCEKLRVVSSVFATSLASSTITPLYRFAEAIAKAESRAGSNCHISVVLPFDKGDSGSHLVLQTVEPNIITWQLAWFIVHVENLNALIAEQRAAGNDPFDRAHLELTPNGSLLVRWVTKDSMEPFTATIESSAD